MSYDGYTIIYDHKIDSSTKNSDYIVDLKDDHHHESATGGAQLHAKRVNP